MQSEFDFIKRIREQATKRQAPGLILGIGDDAAVIQEQKARETLITVDLLVEEVDFRLEYTPPLWLGHKALAVSLSDIAAMGGNPAYSLLTLGVPKQFQSQNSGSKRFFDEFFAGYFALAEKHNVSLIGGDISSTPDHLTIDSIVIGHCPAGKALRRSGAKIGDAIYLTGQIGASASGLKLLMDGFRVNEGEDGLAQSAMRAHLRPEPRVEFGRRVGEFGLAHSMIDISDGVAQDLAHICEESGVAAILDFDSTPLANEISLIHPIAETWSETAFDFAIRGGEDFELLLTADPNQTTKLVETATDLGLKFSRIGDIVPASKNQRSSLLLRRRGEVNPLSIRGFDHFPV